jgi:hypothetical protein
MTLARWTDEATETDCDYGIPADAPLTTTAQADRSLDLFKARVASDAVTIRTVTQLEDALTEVAENYQDAYANGDIEGEEFAEAEAAALKAHPLYPALLAAWAAEPRA